MWRAVPFLTLLLVSFQLLTHPDARALSVRADRKNRAQSPPIAPLLQDRHFRDEFPARTLPPISHRLIRVVDAVVDSASGESSRPTILVPQPAPAAVPQSYRKAAPTLRVQRLIKAANPSALRDAECAWRYLTPIAQPPAPPAPDRPRAQIRIRSECWSESAIFSRSQPCGSILPPCVRAHTLHSFPPPIAA